MKNTIEELGFKEESDYNGKMVLKNNVPIKKTMDFREVGNLVDRLKQNKKVHATCKMQQSSGCSKMNKT